MLIWWQCNFLIRLDLHDGVGRIEVGGNIVNSSRGEKTRAQCHRSIQETIQETIP